MKKSYFLALTVVFCIVISFVATVYPVTTIAVGVCSLPFLFFWCVITDSNRLKDKKITKKTN